MPECPNCHKYYIGTPTECPECHESLPAPKPTFVVNWKFFVAKLFDNPGKKIQTLAKVLFWIGAIFSIIGGLIVFAAYIYDAIYWEYFESVLLALLGLVGVPCIGTLISWLSALGIYAFGSFVKDTAESKETLCRIEEKLNQSNQRSENANEQ